MKQEQEEWRAIPGVDGYEASSLGRIRSIDRTVTKTYRGREYTSFLTGRVLKAWRGGEGYLYVGLGGDGPRTGVHRLVCAAFNGPSDLEAAHWNGDRTDNRVANLRWATPAENAADKRRHGTHLLGKSHPFRPGQKRRGTKPSKHPCAATIRALRNGGTSLSALAALFKMSTSGMHWIVKCRT